MLRVFSLILILAFSAQAFASRVLPTGLTWGDRKTALEILGFGTSTKLLSSPYPLGGYSGVEVSVSSEYIPLTDVSSLGNKTADRSDFNYYNITIGKGLYYNVDVLVQFTPVPQDESISGFGGQVRWGFYEASFMPLALSLVLHGADVNFADSLGAETVGEDLIASVNMQDVSLFFGLGQAHSIGNFHGGQGVDAVTDSGNNETADIKCSHTMFGVSFKMAEMFVSLEVDRFVQSTYAGKLGMRF